MIHLLVIYNDQSCVDIPDISSLYLESREFMSNEYCEIIGLKASR